MKINTLLAFAICLFSFFHSYGYEGAKDSIVLSSEPTPVRKFYVGNSLDGTIFSTSTTESPYNSPQRLSTLRFTMFINVGITFNYDFSRHFGIYTGVDLKNVGFIEKIGDSTVKRRTYNLGIPVGIKFGNVANHFYGFIGGGVDAPVNYREKGFVKRGDKQKFNEWFSSRTPAFMPYVFAGVCVKPGVTIKLQYYLNNYMNTDFTENMPGLPGGTYKPYAGYNIHLILLSLGMNMKYSKEPMRMGKHSHMHKEQTSVI